MIVPGIATDPHAVIHDLRIQDDHSVVLERGWNPCVDLVNVESTTVIEAPDEIELSPRKLRAIVHYAMYASRHRSGRKLQGAGSLLRNVLGDPDGTNWLSSAVIGLAREYLDRRETGEHVWSK